MKSNRSFFKASIRTSVWAYFGLFAIIMLILMWFLQVFFLNNYYDKMKISTTEKYIANFTYDYKVNGIAEVSKKYQDSFTSTDTLMRLENKGMKIYSSDDSSSYQGELETLKSALLKSGSSHDKGISMILTGKKTKRKSWAYATYLDKKRYTALYAITPLYPVNSTIAILQEQLIYITIISLGLALILSFFLSTKLTKPIVDLTRSARRLGEGTYTAVFENNAPYSEINDLIKTLNKAASELGKSTLLQKDLMANVSHDLRTPLTMVKSYAEMIRDLSGDNPEKRNKHLQVIIDESDRLNSLVSDVLTLSSVQAGTMNFIFRDFSLKETFESIIPTYDILKDDGFVIQFNCRQDAVVHADETKIKRVITNLLNNSIKYCGEDKKVFVNMKRWNNKVHCEFVDHGVGISPEELPNVWDRYYKSSSNHVRTTTGSGIGLSIVKEILLAHGAKFGVETKVDHGTTFWFELDIAADDIKQNKTKKNKNLLQL